MAVIGGGVTGLAVGRASGGVVYEAAERPGGICASYYLRPGSDRRLDRRPADGDAFRFEVGGGHWIFGGQPDVLELIEQLAPTRTHERRASVHIASSGQTVPYPFQDHAGELDPALLGLVPPQPPAAERKSEGEREPTMAEWLLATFGPALCARFFFPFHQRYTAGLYRGLAAQDPQKSPRREPGYNPTYRYPVGGLDVLIRGLAEPVDLRCAMAVTAIDLEAESLHLADGSEHRYADLVSTLDPMATLALCGAKGEAAVARLGEPDPFTSVLVSNLGGQRGPACPDDHWIYDPESRSGSHRYGIYSNVDASFVPREDPDRVAIYVEHGFRGGDRPSPQAAASILQADVRELQDRGVLGEVEVADPSWVEVAYTWRRPGSTWATDAASALAAVGVTQVGRYGRWHFQGIAESIGEGLAVGASLVADRSMA